MRIGIDIDEVLADHLSSLIQFHNDTYGTHLERGHFKTYRFWETWGGTRDEAIRKMYSFYATPYFHDTNPVIGSQEAIRTLSQNHELHLITGRPDDTLEATRQWVDRHFPDTFSGLHHANLYSRVGAPRSKSEICDSLGIEILVDDILDYALECVRPHRKILLLDAPWNQQRDLPQGIHRIHSWGETLDFLR